MTKIIDGVDWSKPYNELLADGYVPVDEIVLGQKRLAPGVRVCHNGQRWPGASQTGTAVIAAVVHKPNSQWEKDWHHRDIEVIAITDTDRFGTGRIGRWADYHCVIATEQPEVASA